MRLFPFDYRQHKFLNSREMLAVITTCLSIAALSYSYPKWMHISDFDGIANLNIGRFITHGFTPGFSQIGVWNLLNHIMLAPVTAVDFWYITGTAGFIIHVPSFFLTAYCIHRLCAEITDDEYASFVAAIVFALNPFVLMFVTSPMSEPMFFLLLSASGMFMAQWIRRQSMERLLLSAACIALGSIARFEAFALVPIGMIVVSATCSYHKCTWSRLFSEVLLFTLVTITGPMFVIAYSWFYTGNPLYFVTYSSVSDTLGAAVPRSQTSSTSILNVIRLQTFIPTFTSVLRLQFSAPLIVFALMGISWLAVRRQQWGFMMTIITLLAPTLFVIAAFITGRRFIGVPPFSGQFTNIRYVLHAIVLLSFLCGCTVAAFRAARWRFVRHFGTMLGVALLLFLSMFSAYEFFVDRFYPIRFNVAYAGDLSGSTSFAHVYDFGNVLMSHGDNETFIYESHIPFGRIVYESNYLYYIESLHEPWLFVRWVVLNSREGIARDTISKVFFTHVKKEIFFHYYELVLEDGGRQIYRIREPVMRAAVQDLGYDPKLIPSLNTDADWEPAEFYEVLRALKH